MSNQKKRQPEMFGPRTEAYRLRAQGKKRCSVCQRVKSLVEFNLRNRARGYYMQWCRVCTKTDFGKYYKEHQPAMCARSSAYHAHWKDRRFAEVLAALGTKCACCGESEPDFLTVDHIHRDGWKEKQRTAGGVGRSRSGRALWSKLRREGYPKDKYRILCFNCNCGRERRGDGICPHQRKKLVAVS